MPPPDTEPIVGLKDIDEDAKQAMWRVSGAKGNYFSYAVMLLAVPVGVQALRRYSEWAQSTRFPFLGWPTLVVAQCFAALFILAAVSHLVSNLLRRLRGKRPEPW